MATNQIRGKTAIIGTGYSTPITRHSEQPLGALAVQAVKTAARDAGIDLSDIDGLAVYPNPSRFGAGGTEGIDVVSGVYLARALGLVNLRWSAQVSPGSFVGSIVEAAQAIAAGACTYALVWRAMHSPQGQFGRYSETSAEGNNQYLAPYGLTNYVLQYALQYSRYLSKYGASREHLATFVVNNRANAARNPDAIFFEKALTRDDYLSARIIAYPYCILDCDMPVDVCSAVIVTSADRAREIEQPAYILGYASLGMRSKSHVLTTLEDFEEAAGQVGSVLWGSAGVGPRQIDIANIYDGFSGFIYYFLEGYGFCKRGEAYEFIQDGRIELGGDLPLNTNGGSLGMGRLHGGAQVIEAVRQIQGRCGPRQVPHSNLVVAGSGNPGVSHGSVVLASSPST